MKAELGSVDFLNGCMILVDKPYGWTSFAVVAQLKKWTMAKIGHAGTLDPLASGLMICCTGSWTKKLTGLLGLPKQYTGIIQLGATTPTYDLESLPENQQDITAISQSQVIALLNSFTGIITQTPPIHSAVKQEGKPVYELARQGKDVVMKSRQVTISQFELIKLEHGELHFLVDCSSGTYIRTLANDVGKALGCGAYLKMLRRTAIGEHRIEDAYTIDEMALHFGSRMNARIIEPKMPVGLVSGK
jgi:tRNA pseudouridine55 synthase